MICELEKEMVAILDENVSESDRRFGAVYTVVHLWFYQLKNESEELRRNEAYNRIYGFIWAMYILGIIDTEEQNKMVEQLIKEYGK
ncbi:MAG: hypothetical protein NC409_11435 [Clostridium sp.]|nr:hypothetical protein [Clostridium sp.]